MPVGSVGPLSSRKRVWTGEVSDSGSVEDDVAIPADCQHFTQPRKHLKRVHIPHSPPPYSSAPTTAQAAPPSQPPALVLPSSQQHRDTATQPLNTHTTAFHSLSLVGLHSSSATATTLIPSSPPAPTPPCSGPPFLTESARGVGSRKRNSADFHSSSVGAEGVSHDAGGQERRKRHNSQSSFTFPPSPLSPDFPAAPAAFTYEESATDRLSSNNVLLRSLHAERISRRQQQTAGAQHASQPSTDGRTAGSVSLSARPQLAAVGEGEYSMMPLYAERGYVFDSDYSWASGNSTGATQGNSGSNSSSGSGSSSSSSSSRSAVRSQLLSTLGWSSDGLLSASLSPRGSQSGSTALSSTSAASAAATSMSDDSSVPSWLHRTNSNESMNDA